MGLNGEVLKSASLNLFCLQQKVSSLTTCKKWVQHYTIFGHINPKRATGNLHTERELCDEWLVYLSVYWRVYPKQQLTRPGHTYSICNHQTIKGHHLVSYRLLAQKTPDVLKSWECNLQLCLLPH